MIQTTHSRSYRSLFFSAVLLLVLSLGVSVVLAQQSGQSDGRINRAAHFGGDALYCLDGNFQPTVQYPTSEGGFRLLNVNGQVLWFVSYVEVQAALEQFVAGGQPVLIATEQGSYGENTLSTYKVGSNDVYFIFTGYDEHGKFNSLTFKFCIPVNGSVSQIVVPTTGPTSTPAPIVTEEPTDEPTEEPTVEPTQEVTEEPTVEPTQEVTEEPTQEPLMCVDYDNEDYIPCDQCPSGWYTTEGNYCYSELS